MMRSRKFLGWLLVAVALCATNVSREAKADVPFLVGVISPMTGPMGPLGPASTSAILWWEQSVNAAGGIRGRQVKVEVCDDEGNPEKAVTCARRFMENGAVLLLDNSVSGTIRAIMPMLGNGPVMIVASPIINPDPETYVFQVSPTDLDITKGLLNYLKANNIDKLAMIASTDTTGEANAKNAQQVFPAAGVKLSLARIDLGATDASIQLANIVKDNPIIYSGYSGAGAATVVKSFYNLGLNIPFIISNANLTEAFMNLIKDSMPPRLLGLGLGVMVPDFLKEPGKKRFEDFKKSYEASNKQPIALLTLQGLMMSDTAEAVLRNVGNPKDAVAVKHFLETTPVSSIVPIVFSASRHVGTGPEIVAVMEYKNKRWVVAGPVK
jgi:branched-chain amino acid transport system substrate-binding protein